MEIRFLSEFILILRGAFRLKASCVGLARLPLNGKLSLNNLFKGCFFFSLEL